REVSGPHELSILFPLDPCFRRCSLPRSAFVHFVPELPSQLLTQPANDMKRKGRDGHQDRPGLQISAREITNTYASVMSTPRIKQFTVEKHAAFCHLPTTALPLRQTSSLISRQVEASRLGDSSFGLGAPRSLSHWARS